MNDTPNTGRARRYTLIGIAAILAVVLIGFFWMVVLAPHPMDFAGGTHVALAEYHGEDPTGVPAELKGASLIERGQYLARAADCEACHTAEGGEPFAGGRAFVLPFGTLYATNITPDKETGIGNYSDANFLDAVHKGIAPGNEKLYPAMPFTSYAYMTDADVGAIKAYLFSLKPVHAPDRENSLSFPFNQRSLMGIWALLFNPDKRFEPRTGRDPQWNRGAYLVEAMEHCGECHTPRNLLQALDQRQKFAGTVQAGWRAYNITSDPKSGIGAWSEADLAHYLAIGHADGRGTATGPMGEAVDNSLRYLTESDITAMVTYLRSVSGIATPSQPRDPLGDTHRCAVGERPHCDQCGADHSVRRPSAFFRYPHRHAGVRRRLFRRGDRKPRQLRHRPIRRAAVGGHGGEHSRASCRGLTPNLGLTVMGEARVRARAA